MESFGFVLGEIYKNGEANTEAGMGQDLTEGLVVVIVITYLAC